jgi:HEAT repeat protein
MEDKTAHIESDNKEYITLEKEQEIVSEPLEKEQEIVSEPSEKEQEIVSEPSEKEQEIVSEPDTAEDQISKSIAEMQVVLTRLRTMEGAIESLPSAEKIDMIKSSSVRAAEWIEKETAVTPAYKEICNRLQTLLHDFINYGFFAEARPIINVLSKINTGTLKKDIKMREVSSEVLQKLASENNLNILFNELRTNKSNKKFEAGQLLTGFGLIIMKKLLNSLRDSNDSKERINIIHIIEEIGYEAIPDISANITTYATWYYLRNIAYILGHIGNENSAHILLPLLLHKEKRVRMEAFKSINQTAGNKKGPLLLSVLPQVENDLRVNIIEMLGKIRCTEAVTDLQDMLKSKSSMTKDEQISMQQKICQALGAIGSPAATKTLSDIVESKSILGIGSYPKEVKYAAEKALASIRKK